VNKQKILNWVGGIWFLVNFPIIPFVGPAVYIVLGEFFFDEKIPYALVTFGVFILILLLSKVWVGKYVKTPVILSLIIFLWAVFQLVTVQDFLISYRPVFYLLIFVVLVGVVCIAVVKAMRGELTK